MRPTRPDSPITPICSTPYTPNPRKIPIPKTPVTRFANFLPPRNPLQTNHFQSPLQIVAPVPPARRASLKSGKPALFASLAERSYRRLSAFIGG